ncbi:DUF2933 domain-containing protein [Planomonospora parontospora]|uniref:DUF2933 domain-containing protein n=1 Tax=Planomonospora parontospora TaxID=58119 RepID=UPI0016714537|nr:DUF2933 domain-containing protein [Planomonospora parontospora]GGL58715.1 hypothetical protein GCM10014719_70140 [Planomonospora parontospora subsp. antibiotica]GII18007.1 hypothetical protein Ppa05_47330 [Planomonospora parontospora subsp. antibiotica]
MKRNHLPLYAIALAVLIVGGLAFGAEAETLLLALLVLTCPLMMLFMGHGGHGHGGGPDHRRGDGRPPAVRH